MKSIVSIVGVHRELSCFVTHLPEVLYHRITFGVTAVVGVLLPVVDIDICDTANEQLKLTLIEDVDQVSWDELVEALHKGIELLVDTLLNAPFCDEPEGNVSDGVTTKLQRCCDLLNVFLLVLVGHLNVPATLLEVHNDLLTESLIVDREGRVDDVSDVVLHGPGKSAVELCIHTLHIGQRDPLLQDHLVECTNEECIQEAPVEDSQTDNTTNELEVSKMLRVDAGVWVNLEGVVVVGRVFEQTVEGVEHFVRKQEEELSVMLLVMRFLFRTCAEEVLPRETSIIQTIFAVELDHQSLLQIVWTLAHDLRI